MFKDKKNISNLIKKTAEFFDGNSHLCKTEEFITGVFKQKDNIRERVIILDSLYSTNLSKTIYQIDDLVERLKKEEKEHAGFKNKKFEDIIKLRIFQDSFGIKEKNNKPEKDEEGLSGKKPLSFLTKYFYFLTEFKFPIRDSFIVDSLKDLRLSKFKLTTDNFFKEIIEIKNELNCTFKELDKFLWLYGKMKPHGKEKKPSFTTFLNKEQFQNNKDKIAKFYESENYNLANFEKILTNVLLKIKK